MAEQTLLDRIARTNAYPANQPLPAAWLDEVLDAHTQGIKTMSTTQKIRSVEPEATPPTPRRWKGAIAAIAVLVAAIATTVIMTGDGEVATTANPLDSQVRTAALNGEPLAVTEAWWWAYWSGDVALLAALTDREVTSLGTYDELIGDSEFQSALHNGEHWWTVSDCQLTLGFDDRYL